MNDDLNLFINFSSTYLFFLNFFLYYIRFDKIVIITFFIINIKMINFLYQKSKMFKNLKLR